MVVVGGADEAVVGDVHQPPQIPDAPLPVHDSVHEFLGGDAGLPGLVLDLLAVLVSAGEEHDVIAAKALVAGKGVGGHSAVGVADVQLIRWIVDGRGDVELLTHWSPPHIDPPPPVCSPRRLRFWCSAGLRLRQRLLCRLRYGVQDQARVRRGLGLGGGLRRLGRRRLGRGLRLFRGFGRLDLRRLFTFRRLLLVDVIAAVGLLDCAQELAVPVIDIAVGGDAGAAVALTQDLVVIWTVLPSVSVPSRRTSSWRCRRWPGS
jgi:hypothetical protein